MASNLGVKTTHPEYTKNAPRWERIRDVISGHVKKYLRDVGASEPDTEYAKVRQDDYVDGAIYYNFTQRTLAGMVGAVTRKPAEIDLPESLKYLIEDCDGNGMSLEQQAQDALADVDSLGRAGLLVDSKAVGAATMAQQNAGDLNPKILLYTAENVINWARDMSRVVLRETYEYQNPSNEFETLIGELYRVLEIVGGAYQQRIFKFDNLGAAVGEVEIVTPAVSDQRLKRIPFYFIGSENNDSCVDNPPLESLADVNIGHYRNSADVEESAHITGQPTLMLYPGERLTAKDFKESNPNGIRLGSRSGHNLGSGGGAELLQAQASTISRELMADKEEQAVKIGAQLITPSSQITAESARLQRGADTSIMASVANNVSEAYQKALALIAEFLRASGEVKFQLNTEFFMQQMTAQDRAAWMADINAGLLPQRAYWAALRAAGVTKFTDEEIEGEIENQPPAPAPEMDIDVEGDIPEAPEDE